MSISDIYAAVDAVQNPSPRDLARLVLRADDELSEIEAEGFRETIGIFADANGIDSDEVFRLVRQLAAA